MLFLETMRHADRLRAVRRARRAGRQAGARLQARPLARRRASLPRPIPARSPARTKSADAFLRDCGIARVHTLSALIEGLPLLARVPAMPGRRGPQRRGRHHHRRRRRDDGRCARRAAASRWCRLGRRPMAVRAAGINAAAARLIDLTLAGVRYDVMKAGPRDTHNRAGVRDGRAVVGSSAQFYPELAVQPIIDTRAAGRRKAGCGVSGPGSAAGACSHSGGPGSPISTRRKPAPMPSPRRSARRRRGFCRAGRGARCSAQGAIDRGSESGAPAARWTNAIRRRA